MVDKHPERSGTIRCRRPLPDCPRGCDDGRSSAVQHLALPSRLGLRGDPRGPECRRWSRCWPDTKRRRAGRHPTVRSTSTRQTPTNNDSSTTSRTTHQHRCRHAQELGVDTPRSASAITSSREWRGAETLRTRAPPVQDQVLPRRRQRRVDPHPRRAGRRIDSPGAL